jgi:hypothetical protein
VAAALSVAFLADAAPPRKAAIRDAVVEAGAAVSAALAGRAAPAQPISG